MASTANYSHLIKETINRRKKKQQVITADKQRTLELEEKYKKQSLYVEELQSRIRELENECKAFETSIMRKQELYRDNVARIRIEKRKENGEPFNFDDCQEIHAKILSRLQDKKFSTKALILAKERELVRNYESQLVHLKSKNEKLRGQRNKGGPESANKMKKLQEENDWMKQVSSNAEQQNKQLTQTNRELSQQLSTLEQDRAFLIKQVIAVKKENKNLHLLLLENTRKLKHSAYASSKDIGKGVGDEKEHPAANKLATLSLTNPSLSARQKKKRMDVIKLRRPQSAITAASRNYSSFRRYHTMESENASNEIDARYLGVIQQLKKQLNSEKERAKRFEYKLNQRIAEENELQTFLRRCLEKVQTDIHQHMKSQRRTIRGGMTNSLDLKQFDSDDQKEVLRNLLTQDRVLQILFKNMFPSSCNLHITNRFDDKMNTKQNKKKYKTWNSKAMKDGTSPLTLASPPIEQLAQNKQQPMVAQESQLELVKDIALKAFE